MTTAEALQRVAKLRLECDELWLELFESQWPPGHPERPEFAEWLRAKRYPTASASETLPGP